MIDVTQDNLYLLLPGKITCVINIIAEETKEDPFQLLKEFYKSPYYKYLENESTKYWHLGPADISRDFKNYLNKNSLI